MEVLRKLVSKDGSVKYLFKLEDSNTIETLYMHDRNQKLTYQSTVCVSSQVGCKLGCIYCATGMQGYVRNLSADEIVQQVSICNFHYTYSKIPAIDAVVFAGMGEPLLNYENVKMAIHKIYSDLGINHFEVVTVGIVPYIHEMIKDFYDKGIHIRLNISLHASTNELRKKLIPFTVKYDIDAIIRAAVEYAEAFDTKVRMRYMIFKGLNDTGEDVERLWRLLEDKPIKLIISQYNENNVPGLIPPSHADILEFCEKVGKKIDCGTFYNFGNDIKGGCGQLRRHISG